MELLEGEATVDTADGEQFLDQGLGFVVQNRFVVLF
jgi:hypothetical protein